MDPKTFKYLSNDEIMDVEEQLLAIYPPPRRNRNNNNNNNKNNENTGLNNSQPKLINDIDQLAQELGITVLHFIHLIKKIKKKDFEPQISNNLNDGYSSIEEQMRFYRLIMKLNTSVKLSRL